MCRWNTRAYRPARQAERRCGGSVPVALPRRGRHLRSILPRRGRFCGTFPRPSRARRRSQDRKKNRKASGRRRCRERSRRHSECRAVQNSRPSSSPARGRIRWRRGVPPARHGRSPDGISHPGRRTDQGSSRPFRSGPRRRRTWLRDPVRRRHPHGATASLRSSPKRRNSRFPHKGRERGRVRRTFLRRGARPRV